MCWRICGSSVKNETDFKAGYVSGLEKVCYLEELDKRREKASSPFD